MTGDVRARAARWVRDDPEPRYRTSVQRLLDLDSPDGPPSPELEELFGGRLAFGTAGLRAPLGPGPNRMNRKVVRETTAGLMEWLPKGARVVIGYDARHGSAQFAADVADVVSAGGGVAESLPRPLPTPVLAAAVLWRSADAGVMITASHNPPQDNGYKLYLGDGIQLVPPADVEIAAAIDRVAARGTMPEEVTADGSVELDEAVVEHHLDLACAALVSDARDVRCVYTPLHGVGGAHLLAAFERAGFPRPEVVRQQFEPDPEFPTVGFPNPEEPGALDLALALASAVSADLVLANDPDADRLAVAIPARPDDASNALVPLTGDELGVLLADHLIRHRPGDARQVAVSLVSSRLLAAMAAAAGVHCTTTLTGFKWVARPIVEHPELDYLLGYEEAIGYAVGGLVRDKDGISAALVAAEMVADAKRRGETLWDRLDRLAVAHGLHATMPLTVRPEGSDALARISRLVAELVSDPPAVVAGSSLVELIDLSVGVDLFGGGLSGGGLSCDGDLPPTEGVLLRYADDTRVIVRPSGTEPKLKGYLEAIVPVSDVEGLPTARTHAKNRLAVYREVFAKRFAI